MDIESAAFWFGVTGVILSFCWIAYVSVVGEALHNYALSYLFDLIPESDQVTQRKFEDLCARDDEFIQVAEVGRIFGFVLHSLSWTAIVLPQGPNVAIVDILTLGMPVVAAATVISLVVCVIIVPPLILRHREEAALLVLLPTFAAVAIPFKPLTAIGGSLRRIGARIEGVNAEETPEESFEDELADSLEGAEREGVLDEDEREMIHNVVELGKTPASRAMIPRTDMICVDVQDGIEGALKLAIENGHSRIPVYEGDRDHIVGVFYTRDLVPSWTTAPEQRMLELRKIIRPARFWPAGKPLDDLLREMRADRLKIAILTDEQGGTAGMITLEDILEEIVGDIQDEYDAGEVERSHRAILPFSNDEAEADGDVDLDEVNRVLEIELPEAPEYNSVGGLILHYLGRLANPGDHVDVPGYRLTVTEADQKRIRRVRISRLADATETELKR
ncbi:MAG: HlyC/CorC family transporter [Planctomycetes bacterium]|nr:HlyC/CorC family transporter [Planctomycetota bacterium]MCW8134573.1 HlyC/CorC family transporter [Planctomycetota bacterium]